MPKLQPKNLLLDLLYDVAGSLVFGLGLYTFAREGGFATGGFSGLGLMLKPSQIARRWSQRWSRRRR